MILSVTLSKPTEQVEAVLGRKYIRCKIRLLPKSSGAFYYAEFFTETQAFHENFTESQLNAFLENNAGKTFRNCVQRTESEEITFLTSKKGKTTELRKPLNPAQNQKVPETKHFSSQHKKNYLIPEGQPVDFLCALGVMNEGGKVIASKYEKFRQINRFLEFVDDILDTVIQQKKADGDQSPVTIVDFGSGKSYLTFAVHYYMTNVKKLACRIVGLDLKKEVIENCNALAQRLHYQQLEFLHGDIADYNGVKPDIVVTLHACDTATDYALNYAVSKDTKAILSVPCCQHEINGQLSKNAKSCKEFDVFTKYGIVRERFSALLTDVIRAELLENAGYNVNVMEFIDLEGTAKNLLIRAVRNPSKNKDEKNAEILTLLEKLNVSQKLSELMKGDQK